MSTGCIALICDRRGTVLSVVRDDLSLMRETVVSTSLFQLASPGAAEKVGAFLETVVAERAAFDWELTMQVGGQPVPLHFTGGLTGDGNLFVVAARTRAGIDRLYNDLVSVSNEQATMVRALLKEHVTRARDQESRDSSYYDDLTRLNNDLSTAHRELAKSTAELARLNELKNQFLGMAAHDLRNPLGAIVTFSDLLLEEAAPVLSSEHLEFVGEIKTLSQFMLHMVDELLDVSKIEAGRLELHRKPTDVAALLKRSVQLNSPLANKKQIGLELRTPDDPPVVSIDPGKIEQVITNLLTNAIKFSQPGTHVEVNLSRQGDELLLRVRDQGPGIPAAELNKLFQPFQRTSVRATAGESSTGLGLAIVRKIVEGHGGRIWVESEVGKGSTFYVTLPVAGEETVGAPG